MTVFPITQTVPEAVSHLRERGCVQLKSAFPLDEMEALSAQLKEAYTLFEQFDPPLENAFDRQHNLLQFENIPTDLCGSLRSDLTELCHLHISSFTPGNVLRSFFGGSVDYHPFAIRVRYHAPDQSRTSYVPWHQDLSFLDHRVWVTCWVPLVACGIDAPALDFVPVRPNIKFSSGLESDPYGYGMGGINEADIHKHLGGGEQEIWSPVFDVGDCMLFDSYCVHRTHPASCDAKPRMSLEMRFCARA